MDLSRMLIAAATGLFLSLALLRIFRAPLRMAFRLLGNTLLGFLALWLVRVTAGFTGIALGLNLWNALVVGCLGVPGLGLLLLIQWVL